MTRSEREQIIQRYLSGEMSSAEEGDFFIQVALDRELRHDLQAQQTIESAFRKDREAERVGHTALRTRVAAMLAAGPPPPQPAPEQAPGGTAGRAQLPQESLPSPVADPAPPSPSLPAAVARKGSSLLGWGTLAVCAITTAIVLLLADPFGKSATPSPAPGSSPAPSASPAKEENVLPAPPRREDAPAEVNRPGASPASRPAEPERPSSPATTSSTAPSPARPRRQATQDHTSSTVSPRSDGRVHPATTRSSTAPSHDTIGEEGPRREQPSDKMKVGVRVKIKPQQ